MGFVTHVRRVETFIFGVTGAVSHTTDQYCTNTVVVFRSFTSAKVLKLHSTTSPAFKTSLKQKYISTISKILTWGIQVKCISGVWDFIAELMQMCHFTAEDVQGWAVCGVAVLAEPCLCFSFVTMLFPANSRVFWKCFINLRNRRTFSTHKGNITDIYSFIFSKIDDF